MYKSKRLMELMMTVNRKRKFTVKELAEEFDVSSRTILRDLQELSELGVPLYSEVGPHGGYQVLNDRVLPPIAFTEEEAVAIFFSSYALRYYSYLPFKKESSSALKKFYSFMPDDIRDRIDQMKDRFDFVTPMRQLKTPFLSTFLDAAIHQKVLLIDYESRKGKLSREIQPIGIYASNGLWYCPAYCFLREDFRLFRCDRVLSVDDSPTTRPLDLRHVDIGNWESFLKEERKYVKLYVELTKVGVQRCEAELWQPKINIRKAEIGSPPKVHIREDGTGWLDNDVPKSHISFLAKFFIGLGNDATVVKPPELIDCMRCMLLEIMAKYESSDFK
ncbi:WYL domain-containing protein [Virgibacillus dakarensis]|uniref:DeoR family transcriptional regulator n=1 Tax=Lentibacillus populi TaxID=1827502 RepID=A0A9W5X6V4_9BACI|nr:MULTISPECIES: YafY family protein [Bacillaceae]MBT2216827.1 YafY family transcriptional regulator [Virgibacillus dakarensis]MTW86870.1 WYL domain-containing protein [Virgibacillus dakarensis]GGB54335.1 DeoR family transcriptional regulator [Lentibacillus populi]